MSPLDMSVDPPLQGSLTPSEYRMGVSVKGGGRGKLWLVRKVKKNLNQSFKL